MDLFVLVIIFGAATQLPELKSIHFAGIAAIAMLMTLLGSGYMAEAIWGGFSSGGTGFDVAALLKIYVTLFAVYGGVFIAGFGFGRFLEARRHKR
ncbi:hypothetical protein [Sphingorhabdus sp. Alg239-R122]|uniref:hypothetical protein n=1 Tax=Sphingorhabdus sp. Alg239-R122 TaxID=2305989 RepID=UPI0013DCFD1C|nr:hypothetical protein [Sphingorhabdus sp. Alg239-R122]